MKGKKIVILLMCMTLITGMLSACGKKEEETSSNSEITAGDETGDGDETGLPLTELPLPLTEDKAELSVWSFYTNQYVDSPNEVAGVQKMEEITNVHINWETVLGSEVAEKYGLMVAAGDYPDIIYFSLVNGDRQYAGGMEKGIADGVLVDSTPLIENYMPNYKKMAEQYEESRVETQTDTGLRTIWSFSTSDSGPQGENEFIGLVVRHDWLNELGLNMPETLEEWHTVLTAFKEEKGADAPLMIGPSGVNASSSFLSAYGILGGFYQKNGEVKFGPAQPEYKEYLEMMAQWYKEGLVDPNFMSNGALYMAPTDYVANNRTGAFTTFYGFGNQGMVNQGLVTDQPDFYLSPISNPVMNKDDAPITQKIADGIVNSMIGITTSCKNPELAAMWLDYQYTNEGMMLNMYGVEGESYTYAADGSIQFTEQILNNPDGYTATDALSFWARGNGLGLYNWETQMRTYSNYDELLGIEAVWTGADMSLCLPKNMFMTEEEAITYNSTYTAIDTLVQENTVNWIQGAQSLDNFDEFVDTLYKYGLQDCIDIKQDLLDRYNARK